MHKKNGSFRIPVFKASMAIAVFLCAAFSQAAQIDLTGRVSDTLGNPIQGAIVFVKGINKKDTTDASGSYAIQDPSVATVPVKSDAGAFRIEMFVARGSLRVYFPQRDIISLRIHDVSGKILQVVREFPLGKGWGTVPMNGSALSNQVLLVSVEGRSGFHCENMLPPFCRSGIVRQSESSVHSPDLGKRQTGLDTLVVTCRNYKRVTRPLSNFVKVDTIKMKCWAATLRVPGMKYLPSDTFTMGQAGLLNTVDGAPLGQAFPVHKVTLSAFYIDSTEVTQADFQDLMQYYPSVNLNKPQYAVDGASWYDAALYCNARSKRDGLDTVYAYTAVTRTGNAPNGIRTTNLTGCATHYDRTGYRLPTEAEWEYACRSGTRTSKYWGNAQDSLYIWASNNAGGHTNAVAKKLPNAYKLYDMAGNTWEWTNTFTVQYTGDAQTDPVGPLTGTSGVQLRGAAWHEGYGDVQFYSACRHSEGRLGGTFYDNVGFRVVLSER